MTLNEDHGDDVAALTDNLLLEGIRQGDAASYETLFYRITIKVMAFSAGPLAVASQPSDLIVTYGVI